MEVSPRLIKYTAIVLGALLTCGALYLAYERRQHSSEVRELQNQLAAKDKTIEVQKDVYAKLTLQVEDLKTSIDTSTAAGQRLADEVKKSKGDLLSVSNALIQLRDQVAKGKGTQTEQAGRKRVEFGQDFGYARVDGFTLTDPPEFQLKLGQGSRPLKLALALTQQRDRSWRTLVASSDPNVAVDIGITAVNPLILEPRWYEKLRVHLDLGAGDGVLAGAGASYSFGRFDLGPSVWATTLGGGSKFYGLNLSWAPFKR